MRVKETLAAFKKGTYKNAQDYLITLARFRTPNAVRLDVRPLYKENRRKIRGAAEIIVYVK